ncbi:hypothetical protein [Rhizomonospora bruguierae]|uniref:hypothetical protein n=1 Tax=Rhizomonospora bruguierae TaxID=1581705 RepID=UPI001BCC38B7|nr:hypothetical protein [Micromonospora sp. NBRC 107566]
MAVRGWAVQGWGGSIAVAVGAAAGAGAAQLGLGYGLGIIAWLPASNGAAEAAWVASLGWATWIAATSTVVGAVLAGRFSSAESTTPDGPGTPLTATLWRIALALAAAVGALVTVALIAVPARAATRADTFSPQTIAAGYAILGVIAGLLVAIPALAARAVAANTVVTVAYLWLLAVVTVIDGVVAGRGLGTAHLGVWQFTSERDGYWFGNLYLPGMALSVLSALVLGALAAWPAARRGDGRVGVAISGAVGPLLVAAAYFLTAPNLVGVRNQQLSAYLVAPYALIAGLAGSVLVAAWGSREPAPRALPGVAVPAQRPIEAPPEVRAAAALPGREPEPSVREPEPAGRGRGGRKRAGRKPASPAPAGTPPEESGPAAGA